MKRWISLFVSFAVIFSVFTLSVFADDPDIDLQDLYVYASIVSATAPSFDTELPQQGQLTDRSITNNITQGYTKIKNFSFTCPASSYFLIDFDIVAYDGANTAPNQVPGCYANRNISSYVSTDFSVSGSNGTPRIFRAEVRNYFQSNGAAQFVHYSIFGLNDSLDVNNIVITYTNPITVTSNLITPTGYFFNQRITNVNCKTSVSLDYISNFLEEISTTLQNLYWEIVSIGDTLGNFYDEFHTYWYALYTRINILYDRFTQLKYNSYIISYNATTGVGNVTLNQYAWTTAVIQDLNSIIQYLKHDIELQNIANAAGGNDAYEDLNDAASFGSLTDFAGAGSAASWSSGSFVNGLDSTWSWFTIENKNMIDAVQPSRSEVYISIYDDTLDEYYRILGGD